MISRAVWKKSGQVNFLKDNQIAKFEGRVQLVVFENLRVPICLKFHGEKFTWLLFNNIDAKIWLCFLAAVLIVHYCGHLPSRCRRSRWGFPTRIYFKLLSFSSGIIEFWHLFSVGIRFIAVTSTQKAITHGIPVFRANCFAVLNSRRIFFQSLGFLLFNTFAIAVFGSPRLPDL